MNSMTAPGSSMDDVALDMGAVGVGREERGKFYQSQRPNCHKAGSAAYQPTCQSLSVRSCPSSGSLDVSPIRPLPNSLSILSPVSFISCLTNSQSEMFSIKTYSLTKGDLHNRQSIRLVIRLLIYYLNKVSFLT